jgi:hypothetical protein
MQRGGTNSAQVIKHYGAGVRVGYPADVSISFVVDVNFSPGWGVGTFFSALCLCTHPVANRATGHAQDDLGSYLTE